MDGCTEVGLAQENQANDQPHFLPDRGPENFLLIARKLDEPIERVQTRHARTKEGEVVNHMTTPNLQNWASHLAAPEESQSGQPQSPAPPALMHQSSSRKVKPQTDGVQVRLRALVSDHKRDAELTEPLTHGPHSPIRIFRDTADDGDIVHVNAQDRPARLEKGRHLFVSDLVWLVEVFCLRNLVADDLLCHVERPAPPHAHTKESWTESLITSGTKLTS
jgi:hypothetical protein